MVFDQWYNVPESERKHRLLIEEADRSAPWVETDDWPDAPPGMK